MLTTAPITTVLPVMNLDRAKKFYAEQLGLTPKGASPDGNFLFVGGGGATIALAPRKTGTKAEHTALSFEVQDIEATIHELDQHGIVFEDYDLPGLKTVNHMCILGAEKAAWFKDPEGNILCIHEHLS